MRVSTLRAVNKTKSVHARASFESPSLPHDGEGDKSCEEPELDKHDDVVNHASNDEKHKLVRELDLILNSIKCKKGLSQVEKSRQFSIIYSRKKRIVEKMRLQAMKERQRALENENDRVRRENKKLEELLMHAKAAAAAAEIEKAKKAAVASIQLQQQHLLALQLQGRPFHGCHGVRNFLPARQGQAHPAWDWRFASAAKKLQENKRAQSDALLQCLLANEYGMRSTKEYALFSQPY